MTLRNRLFSSFITLTAIVLVSFLLWFLWEISRMNDRVSDLTEAKLRELVEFSTKYSKEKLRELGKNNLKASIRMLADTLSREFQGKNLSDYDALRKYVELRALATQEINTAFGNKIGTFDVFDKNGLALFHSSPEIEGHNYSEWSSDFPQMWRLVKESFSKDDVSGEYIFLGESRLPTEKYMYLKHIRGTPFILCATVEIDKYSASVENELAKEGKKLTAEVDRLIDESEGGMRPKAVLLALCGFLFMFVTGLILSYCYSSSISKPLNSLCTAVDSIGRGDFSVRVETPGNTFQELQSLAGNFNRLGEQLSDYIEKLRSEIKAREAIEGEISAGKAIQESLLPPTKSKGSGYELYARLIPAKNVSGDFYDYFPTGDGRLAVVMADVSGKGIPAALIMAVCRTLIRTIAQNMACTSPAEILGIANRYLCSENDSSMFVTLFICLYDTRMGSLTFSNAGHLPGILFTPNGKKTEFGNFKRPPLGIDPHASFLESSFIMEPGATIFLYTDGLTDAMSPQKEFYGYDKMVSFASDHIGSSPDDAAESLISELRNFQGDNQFDDMTVLLMRRLIN